MPSNGSTKTFKKPKDVKEFAAQANEVATMVLNGEITPEIARQYSAIARTVAQAASMEVARARATKTVPDLTLE